MSLESLEFGNYLKKLRKKNGVSQELLSYGILDRTLIGRIEAGERYPDKMIRDRLLSRLGERGYDYEAFLQYDDFEHWKLRDAIVTNLNDRNLKIAQELLNKYKERYTESLSEDNMSNVSYQFYLTMMVQLMELEEKDTKDIFEVLQKAVSLTVPEFDNPALSEKLLAVQEINLILEYFSYKYRILDNAQKMADKSKAVMEYVKNANYDKESSALLKSKCAYYYCDSKLRQLRYSKGDGKDRNERAFWGKEFLLETLSICDEGIQSLRECHRVYYLFELLDTKMEIIDCILHFISNLTVDEQSTYKSEYQLTEKYLVSFKEIYAEYGLSTEMCNYVHFYWEMNVACIGDVIRARRKTLGLSQEDLSDICTVKTLRRIENNKSRVQLMLAQALFQRLNLSMEMHRADIETSSMEAIRLEKDFRRACNNRKFDDAKNILDKLTNLISMDSILNRQYIEVGNINVQYGLNEINSAEYVERLRQALNMSIPYEKAIKPINYAGKRSDDKYLTYMETMIFLQSSIIFRMDKNNPFIEPLIDLFDYYKNSFGMTGNVSQRNVIFSHIASYLGNMGDYDRSNELSKEIILQELKHCRLSNVELNIHSIMWNHEKCGLIDNKKMWLLQCLMIDSFCKVERRYKIVSSELEKMKQ